MIGCQLWMRVGDNGAYKSKAPSFCQVTERSRLYAGELNRGKSMWKETAPLVIRVYHCYLAEGEEPAANIPRNSSWSSVLRRTGVYWRRDRNWKLTSPFRPVSLMTDFDALRQTASGMTTGESRIMRNAQ